MFGQLFKSIAVTDFIMIFFINMQYYIGYRPLSLKWWDVAQKWVAWIDFVGQGQKRVF